MSDGHRISGPHIIKLRDKPVQVQLEYHSPPKKESKARTREVTLYQHIQKEKEQARSSKRIHYFNSIKSSKKIKLTHNSLYYYQRKIEEPHPIVAEYEIFHRRMVENQVEPRKLKVYSNSKQLKAVKEKSFPNVLASIAPNLKHAPNTMSFKAPLRKIKLYSPVKTRDWQKENCIKPVEKQPQLQEGNIPHVIKLRGTPDRRYKLEVTSSKSRNKQDSLVSREQRSVEVSKQVKLRFEEDTPERFLKSFNSRSFNEN